MALTELPVYTVSADGRALTVVTKTPSGGTLTATWEREPDAPPWDAIGIGRCLELAAHEAAESGRGSQRSTFRRHRLPFGWKGLSAVSSGPPTWWWPRASIADGGVRAGWLRWCAEVYVRRAR